MPDTEKLQKLTREEVEKAMSEPESEIAKLVLQKKDALLRQFVRRHGSCALPVPCNEVERMAEGMFYECINRGGV